MAVMAHELGHYVLGHSWRLSLGFGILASVALFFAGRIATRAFRELIAQYQSELTSQVGDFASRAGSFIVNSLTRATGNTLGFRGGGPGFGK